MGNLKLNYLQIFVLALAAAVLLYQAFWDRITLPQVASVVAATVFMVVAVGQLHLKFSKKATIIVSAILGIIAVGTLAIAVKHKRHLEEAPSPAVSTGPGIPLEELERRYPLK